MNRKKMGSAVMDFYRNTDGGYEIHFAVDGKTIAYKSGPDPLSPRNMSPGVLCNMFTDFAIMLHDEAKNDNSELRQMLVEMKSSNTDGPGNA